MVENDHHIAIPAEGESPELILQNIRRMKEDDVAWKEGKVWSLVYYANDEHDRLLKDASNEMFSSNYLNPLAFKSLHRMEQEVVHMSANMLHGDEHSVGVMTSGGTESILLAMFCYRERARKLHLNIDKPEVILPATIHPAFDKAAHFFGLHLRKVAVNATSSVIPEEMEKLITKKTILMVASAPNYPHGTMDPIEEIAAIAFKHHIPLHVDGCIGGFMLPWVEKLGYKLSPWDFRLQGVCSVSADVHKFGYGAKGASVLIYKNMDYLRHQFVVTTDYMGGIYISPTLLGTRAGGPIAAAWASMKHLGESGYLSIAKNLMEGTQKFLSGLTAIQGIVILGNPCMNMIAFTTKDNNPDIFVVGDQLEGKGWMVDRQQFPDCIHLTITPTNVIMIDQYLGDLKQALLYAMQNRGATAKGNAAIYGLMARIPFRGMVEKSVQKIMEEMYGSGGKIREDTQEKKEDPLPSSSAWMGILNRVLASRGRWKKFFRL